MPDTKNFTKEHEAGAFLDVYEGGWQEIFPSVNDPTNYKSANLGFHGEIMYMPWNYEVIIVYLCISMHK